MNASQDLNVTADIPSVPPDSLDAGLAAGFGRPAAPRSSLGDMRPMLLREAEGESSHVVKAKSDAMPTPEQTGDRYQLSGEIARGGMGAVLRGRDVDLGRDLAVKVLLEKYANRPEVARRFIEEAQIGGQLQHPGVVPVYDIGRFGDRPFFTMKLVKGLTLAAILGERTDPAADRPRLLNIALQVSQALAYAHAKGVIHRDLKPANIMVGAFGEVQVMDWGLAKVLAEGGIADEERASRAHNVTEDVTTIRTARSTGSTGSFGTETEAGSLLGTPAYMPPEQANGDIANLDRRADVFGLGAILCEILTGKPPYVGRSSEEVRRKACNGDLVDAMARLDACGADQELIALTKTCVAPEAIDRSKDAQAVVDKLTAYLNGVQERLHQAELAEAEARAKAVEEAKRRRLMVAMAGAVLLAVLAGLAGTTLGMVRAEHQRAEADHQRAEADHQRAEAENRQADAEKQQRRAESSEQLAGERLDTVKQLVARADANLEREQSADQLRAGHVDEAIASLRKAIAIDPTFAIAHFNLGVELHHKGQVDEAIACFKKAVELDPKDAMAQNGLGAALSIKGQVDEAIPHLKRAIELDPKLALAHGNLGIALARKSQFDEAVASCKKSVELKPGNASGHICLGNVLHQQGKRDEAIASWKMAIALDPKNARVHYILGAALQDKGQIDEAIATCKRAIELDPKNAMAHYGLGVALLGKGREDEAVACWHKAIELDPKNSSAHNNLGASLARKGQLDEAIAFIKKAIEFDPMNANAHNNLGSALSRKGQVNEAIARFTKAIELDPKIANAHAGLGIELSRKGQVDEAIASFRKAIELDPKDAKTHFNLGTALYGKGQVDEAIDCWRKTIALEPKVALAHGNLGVALAGKGELEEAIACYRRAIELDPKVEKAHRNLGNVLSAKGQVDEAIACWKKAIELDPKDALPYLRLGFALAGKGELNEAIACYKKAIELDPRIAGGHLHLGNALQSKGEVDEAIACYKKAIELDPKDSDAQVFLSNAERLAMARHKFAAFQNGSYTPASNAERLSLAEWCQIKKLHHTAAGLYAAAFAADIKLADDLTAGHRYNAACHAALAAAGQSEDAAKLDDNERKRLHRQALDWLRGDLALRTKQLETGKHADRAAVQQTLRHWQKDTDLAGLRDAAALAKLPADEQKAFTQLWADVAVLLKKTEEKPK